MTMTSAAIRRPAARPEPTPSQWTRMLVLCGIALGCAAAAFAQQVPGKTSPAPSSGQTETLATPKAKPPQDAVGRVPAWAAQARWYHIFVPRFRNGDPGNDLPQSKPWIAETAVRREENVSLGAAWQHFGGDFAGILDRLPYLKTLGVNTLYLGSVFHGARGTIPRTIDMRHINDAFAVRNSRAQASYREAPPKEWILTASDKAFFDFLEHAHKRGFRIVVEFDTGFDEASPVPRSFQDKTTAAYVGAVALKWSDPNGDGDPSDGVDGWVVTRRSGERDGGAEAFVATVKNANPEALIVGRGKLCRDSADVVDVRWNEKLLTSLVNSLVGTGRMAPHAKALFAGNLGPAFAAPDLPQDGAPVGLRQGMRSLWRCRGNVRTKETPPDSDLPGREAYARYRLMLFVQHFLPGVPVTFYGDEVGMFGAAEPYDISPMWWPELPDPKTKSPHYRGDLFGLVQWLHEFRTEHAPLRTGSYRPVMLDERKRLLAFARSLPGDEVVLVMNYGDTKRKVMVPVGRPGQLVAVITPHLQGRTMPNFPRTPKSEKPDLSKPMRQAFSGSRQFVNDLGEVRVWVEPMSVRIILISDKEPRR